MLGRPEASTGLDSVATSSSASRSTGDSEQLPIEAIASPMMITSRLFICRPGNGTAFQPLFSLGSLPPSLLELDLESQGFPISDPHSFWEPYDMEADRTERDNLSRDFPVRVPEMIQLYEKWEKRVRR